MRFENLNCIQSTRQDREHALASSSHLVTTFCLLTNEIIDLLDFLTDQVIQPFMQPDMVGRMAQMLNYFLYNLAGPKSLNLKVRDPKRFHFEPRTLLSKTALIYLHFGKESAFLEAVVKDVRSFNISVFHNALKYITKWQLLPQVDFGPSLLMLSKDKIEEFIQFAKSCEEMGMALDQDEGELGEIPDEFLGNPLLIASLIS